MHVSSRTEAVVRYMTSKTAQLEADGSQIPKAECKTNGQDKQNQ
jgi:hypothetical protein